MACDPVPIIPSLICCGPSDTTKDFINRAYVSFSGFDVRAIPEFASAQYAWDFGMSRIASIDLDRPFEASQTHEYSRFVSGEWYIQNPTWQTFPGPSWSGPSVLENQLNPNVIFNSGQGKYGFQGEKIRIKFTRTCIHSIYTSNPSQGGALVSFTVYRAGEIGEFPPLLQGPSALGPWQNLWPCRSNLTNAPAHVINACAQNPFA